MTMGKHVSAALLLCLNSYLFFMCSTNWNAGLSITAGLACLAILGVYGWKKQKIRLPQKEFLAVYLFFAAMVIAASYLTGNPVNGKKALTLFSYSLPLWIFYLLLVQCPEGLQRLWAGSLAGSWVLDGYGIKDFLAHGLTERINGPTASPNTYAMVWEVLLPWLLYGTVQSWQEKKMGRFALLLATSLVSTGLLLGSFSRGGIVGFFIGGIVVLLTYLLQRKGWGLKRCVCALFLCSFVLTGILFKTASFYDTRSYDGERKLLWTAAYQMWSDHKVSGVGITTWNSVYRQKYIARGAREPNLALPHNNIANFFSATGTLGGIGYLVFAGYTFYFLLRKRYHDSQNGLLLVMLWIHTAFYIHGMVDNTMFGKYGLRLYFAFWGMTLASIYDDKKLRES
ncbi:MAG: hypothetical protein ACFWTX_08095 [Acidaminococcus timonensis]|jgi:O-antigen ligase